MGEYWIYHDEIEDKWQWELKRDGEVVAKSVSFDDEWTCREQIEWIRVHAADFDTFPPII